jgi:ATP-binding cassette, subfamily B, bacterial PglK
MPEPLPRSVFKNVYSILTPGERKGAIVLLGLMVIGMFLETLGIGLVVPLIGLMMQDDLAARYPLIQPTLDKLGNPDRETLTLWFVLGLVGVYLLKNAFLAFLTWRQNSFTYGFMARLSQSLLAVYLRQPYAFHLRRNSAQLIRNITNEGDLFTSSVVVSALHLTAEALVVLGISVLLLSVEPVGAVIVSCVLLVAVWGFGRLTRAHIGRWGLARQFHGGLRLQHIQQGLGGVKDIKLLGREGEFLDKFAFHNLRYTRAVKLQNTLLQMPKLWLEMLAVTGLVILILIMLAQNRPLPVIVPVLGLFAAAAFRLMPSIVRIIGAVQNLRYGLPIIDLLNEEFRLPVPVTEKQPPKVLAFKQEIRLARVSYRYPEAETLALAEISVIIRKGETVGFIGPSGSGKSTLVDVILGLFAPTGGRVAVDGVDIQEDLRGWQGQVGYVAQSIYLTDDTLTRNIAFGLPDAEIDEAAVMRAIRAAQLEELIDSLPSGVETVVGERGIRLSGGQRQRIGIARALYHDPAVLVLDEATSALDTATENSVMGSVAALHGSKTIVIIAHRLTTVQHCDRLYRLQEGKIVEEGTPETMLSKVAERSAGEKSLAIAGSTAHRSDS